MFFIFVPQRLFYFLILFIPGFLYAEQIFKAQNLNAGLVNETQIQSFDNGQLVGFISYTKIPWVPYCILHSLYVYPWVRNQGQVTQLLEFALTKMQHILK